MTRTARLLAKALVSLFITSGAWAFIGPVRGVMEGIQATAGTILVDTTNVKVDVFSLKVSSLTPLSCVQTDSQNNLVSSPLGLCGTGGGGVGAFPLAIISGTVIVTSPTANINIDTNTLVATAIGAATSTFKVNGASVTLQGNAFNGNSQLVQTNGTGQLPAISGALLTAIPGSALVLPLKSGDTSYIENTNALQTGATFYVSSGTVAGKFTITSTMDPSLIVDPLNQASILYSKWITGVTGTNTQASSIFSFFENTSGAALPLADGIADYAWARDIGGADINLQGGEWRVLGQGAKTAQYEGGKILAQWTDTAAPGAGTTANLFGLEIQDQITDVNGVGKSTCTVAADLLFDNKVGSGTAGGSWTIYGPDVDPNWLQGSLGLGGAFQPSLAALTVGASTMNATGSYAMVVGTISYGGALPASQFIMSITTTGVMNLSQLAASKLIKTDASKNLISYDLNSATQTWTGSNTFISSTTFVGAVLITAHTGLPSLSSCGSSPSITGTDRFGIITEGGGSPTSCTVTFSTTWGSAPFCVASTTSTVVQAAASVPTTVQFTINSSANLASDTIQYTCGNGKE